MAIATPEVYAEMLARAKAGACAYPAINCTSSQSIVAAIRGFAEAESDGIVQFSWGGAEFASGQTVKDMVTGAVALAEFAHVVAEKYDVQIALHTDHCPKEKLDGYMRPLIDVSLERVAAGRLPLFQSHMWDGSAVPLEENLDVAEELLDKCHRANIIMELEIGVVGGEEDGIEATHDAKLFSTPEDGLATAAKLGLGERGRYMVPATLGNGHGSHKPGHPLLAPALPQRNPPDVALGEREDALKQIAVLVEELFHATSPVRDQARPFRELTPFFGKSSAYLPVEPKPPAPRAVSSRVSTSSMAACSCLAITSWAMRSPRRMTNGSWPWLIRMTPTSPR